MDFKDQIKQLGERVEKMAAQIQTEEATKNALVMPFITILGYDVFNPFEVNPEFVADIGIKKGEKVDYAIMKEGQPIILIECKHHKEKLDPHNSQLFRYFHTTKAKFGVLTNGVIYRFYTDLVEKNKMDEKPFLEINISDIKESLVEELKKFHKSYFDVEQIVNTASELKYTNEIKSILSGEFKTPSQGFVKFFVAQVYDGKCTEKVMTQFTEIVKKSANSLISDIISDRLKSALDKESQVENVGTQLVETSESQIDKIVTTEEEMEGFFILKAILRTKVESKRIFLRDTQSYLSIILDDNNRKPICRLWLNGGKKYLGLLDDQKKEIKHEITTLDDIYNFSKELLAVVENYERLGAAA